MIEIIIRNYLLEKLSVPVYLERPEGEQMPAAFVFVEKLGSGEKDHIKYASVALQSFGPSLYETMTLNEEVKEAMDSLIELKEIGSSNLDSDYNFTDTSTKKYRYQAVYDITCY